MVIDVKIGRLLATVALATTGFLAIPLQRVLAEPSVRRWGNWLQINAPNPARARPVTLWATYYAIHRAQMVARGQPLIDPAGRSLGPNLSNRDWCYAALEGTVVIDDGRSRPLPITLPDEVIALRWIVLRFLQPFFRNPRQSEPSSL